MSETEPAASLDEKPADRPLKRLLVQASHYGLSSLFTMIAGLVSFPLLTRVFSVADYGVMSVVAATISVAVALGKVGVQHSILRYHSEIVAGKSRFTVPELTSTTFFGMLATGVGAMAVLVAGTQLIPASLLGDARLRAFFAIASFLILVQVVESALINTLRAGQKTAAFMKYTVGKKYLTLGFIIFALFVISRTLTAFYFASVLSEALALTVLLYVLFRDPSQPRPQTASFSRPLYLELLAFGIPMMIGYEMSGIVLAVGDRYVIDALIGEAPLGIYAAAYNLCQYVQAIAILSVGQAIMPIYMQMWAERGRDATAAFISQSLSRYMIFGMPVIAGLAAVGPQLLPALASEKYASAAQVLPWVIAGMVIDGTNAMVGAGLFIHRKTRVIMAIILSCAIFNIVLNLILVPRMGILGSAVATLASYAFAALALATAGRRLLPVALPFGTMLRAGAAAAIMYLAVVRITVAHGMVAVGIKATAGALIYGALIILIDRDARMLAKSGWARLRPS
jgi:O-antigen/teichoic acid export membrane protein